MLDQKILPDWRESMQRLRELNRVPPELQRRIADLLSYMQLRQEGWELMVRAIRRGSPELLRLAYQKQHEADEAAKKFTATYGP